MTIYTTQTCAYCPMVKKYFDLKNVKYKTVDLTNSRELHLELSKTFKTVSVPLIVNDKGNFTTGFNIPKIVELIDEEKGIK